MQTLNVYKCDYCGYRSVDADVIAECEKSHLDMKEAYIISVKYKQGKPVPHTIVLRLGDAELTYYNTAYLFKDDKK